MSTEAPQAFRVLVVEDTADQREIIKISLRPMEVVTAVNGLDGLMKLDRVEPDFIVSDVMMPEMDGWEFVSRVRQRPQYRATPVVFLTALTSREDMKRGYETGADVYLTKPYDPLRLKRNLDVFTEQQGLKPRPKRLSLDALANAEEKLASTPRPESRISEQPEEEPAGDPFAKAAAPPLANAPPKLEVPKAEEPPPPEPKPAEPPPKMVGKPRKKKQAKRFPTRLLVVTADATLAGELQGAAPEGRIEIATAKTSPSAMDKTSLYHPDALMLHWQMPGRHAPALAQLFSESADCRHRPLIVISDKRLGGGDRRLLKNLGVFEVLRRPIDGDRLAEVLADVDTLARPEERKGRMSWSEVHRLEAGGAIQTAVVEAWWEN